MHSSFYRPPMKFGQGNVFTGVYLSEGRGVVITGYMTRGGGFAFRGVLPPGVLPPGGVHPKRVCLQGRVHI